MFHGYGNDEREMIRVISAVHAASAGAVHAADAGADADCGPSYLSFTGTVTRPYMGGAYWYPDGCGVEERRAACSAVGDAVTTLLDASACAGRRLVLVGFSQGAYLSYRMVVEHPRLFDAAVLLSPSFRGEERPDPRTPDALDDAHCHTRFLLAYGSDDRTIPQSDQRTAQTVLAATGRAEIRTYPGMGHAIRDDEITDIAAFLRGLPRRCVREDGGFRDAAPDADVF
nr:dienelactone hydrolase family protein [Bifidobacterium sp. DSM 109958]